MLYACAVQWRESVRTALDGLQAVPDGQQITIRFEDLVEQPVQIVEALQDFVGLSLHEAVSAYARDTVDPGAKARWTRRDPHELAAFLPAIRETLRTLEYDLDRERARGG